MRPRPNRITPKINYGDLIKPLSEKAETQVSWVGSYISNVQKGGTTPQPPVSPSPTPSSTSTPTPTPTSSPTPTPTASPTPTPTPTPSSTPIPPILDTYTALEAYSLNRKLKSDATNAFRVRRSSDNSEQDIGFVGNLVNISSLTSFVGGDSGYITTIYDQTGNERHFSQTSLTKQPIVITGGTLLENSGFIYCETDGVDDELTGTTVTTNIQNLYTFNVGNNEYYTQNLPTTHIGGVRVLNWGFQGNSDLTQVVVTTPLTTVTLNSSNLDEWAITTNKHYNLTNATARVDIIKNGVTDTTTYPGGVGKVRRTGAGAGDAFASSKFQEIIVGSTDSDTVRTNQRDFYNYY